PTNQLPHSVDRLREAATALAQARPTAVNLAWAVHRVMDAALQAFADDLSSEAIRERVIAEARAIHEEDLAANHAMGSYGAAFVPDGARVLTHCNAGALATSGFGTALGVVRSAVLEGKSVAVFADETRPFLQGARLTAWELHRDNIPVSVITDGMAGALMAKGEIDLVVVGADRIARNGDVANKIGTYTVAVLARRHGIPFYVAAPTSTLDIACPSGSEIPIEERADEEVTHVFGVRVTPEGVAVRNPAFDVTPAELVTAIITESGVARAPYERSLAALLGLATDDAALTETAALEIEAIGNGAAPPEASAELGDDHDHEDDSDA
ncbi:MAG: S-methyl-5-thioribose-1-phosphate isomerase, partial [Acidobacteria bacterium]|nr:S-methyl-5-thioribose-1-phosphate isomerase [Acidobacteriota bacterium]